MMADHTDAQKTPSSSVHSSDMLQAAQANLDLFAFPLESPGRLDLTPSHPTRNGRLRIVQSLLTIFGDQLRG